MHQNLQEISHPVPETTNIAEDIVINFGENENPENPDTQVSPPPNFPQENQGKLNC